jgi:hypothetical protein
MLQQRGHLTAMTGDGEFCFHRYRCMRQWLTTV